MTRRPKRKPPGGGSDVLADVLDVLLHVLHVQTCRACLGTGRCPDGVEAGKQRWAACACRRAAQAFLSEFDGFEDASPEPEVDDGRYEPGSEVDE